MQPVRALPSGILAVYIRLTPSLLNRGCVLSLTMKTMSATSKRETYDYCLKGQG